MNLPVRSTLVTLPRGRIIISPGSKLDRSILNKIDRVTDLVAPNLFHCSGVPKSAAIFTSAKTWAPEGAKELKPHIAWSKTLGIDEWPYQDELSLVPIAGLPKVNEFVFVHQESRSLIVADLCFNLIDSQGPGAWLILNLFGTYKKLGISRFMLKFLKDKPALEKSLAHLFTFDFDNIIVGHGRNVIGGARGLLKEAFRERGLLLPSS